MNFATFERAQVAAFAYREASSSGSLDVMRAICYVLRNRVRNGWFESSWLTVMGQAHETAAHVPELFVPMRSQDRLLQMIVRDVDDIYTGQDRSDDNICQIVAGDRKHPVLYWAFVNRQFVPWFTENIIRQSQEHAHIGTIGPLLLYR